MPSALFLSAPCELSPAGCRRCLQLKVLKSWPTTIVPLRGFNLYRKRRMGVSWLFKQTSEVKTIMQSSSRTSLVRCSSVSDGR